MFVYVCVSHDHKTEGTVFENSYVNVQYMNPNKY